MPEEKIQFKPAERIAHFEPYYFISLNQRITELRDQGKDVIRIDIGSPDLPPADFIVNTLAASARKPDVHGYSPYAGSLKYRKAVAKYYLDRFGIQLDPEKEILTLIGSKEGLFILSQVMLNPGDVSLVPDPGYPVYFSGTEIAGGEVVRMPLLAENKFLPDLTKIPTDKLQRAKIIWVNYPNNPTGAVADERFYKELIEYAHRHKLLIASDAPYVDVCFDGYRANSILEYEGAREVTIEFNSLSKTYNMAGWRLGMAVGNAQIIEYLSNYKSQVDTSQFQAVMDAGASALTSDQDWLEERNEIYQYRRDIILRTVEKLGFEVIPPKAAIYIWVKLPAGQDDHDFCNRLLDEANVSATPGSVYGQYGRGYIRISLCSSTEKIAIAMKRFEDWMKKTV
jgi:LL-diaminopimelate aminotransferase